ncbi:MAG: hypothetical protein HQ538_02775 [Parcubacteria group bacterium]|nr:hypothetical protein [Parcubacteria group bacterium]
MALKQDDIDELKEIYRKETGKDISNQEAWEMGINLLELGKLLLRVYQD